MHLVGPIPRYLAVTVVGFYKIHMANKPKRGLANEKTYLTL
jgi:hypothetical protein